MGVRRWTEHGIPTPAMREVFVRIQHRSVIPSIRIQLYGPQKPAPPH